MNLDVVLAGHQLHELHDMPPNILGKRVLFEA